MSLEQVLAAIGFLLCLALLLHQGLGARRQAALQRAWQRHSARLRLWARGIGQRRRERGRAAREAADLIERARRRPDAGPDGQPPAKITRPRRVDDRRNDLH